MKTILYCDVKKQILYSDVKLQGNIVTAIGTSDERQSYWVDCFSTQPHPYTTELIYTIFSSVPYTLLPTRQNVQAHTHTNTLKTILYNIMFLIYCYK